MTREKHLNKEIVRKNYEYIYNIIKGGKSFDGINSNLQKNIKIIVDGNKIIKIGKELADPQETIEIDLENMTVKPGLIDVHTYPYFVNKTDSMTDRLMKTDS